jgi:hypothetical protein
MYITKNKMLADGNVTKPVFLTIAKRRFEKKNALTKKKKRERTVGVGLGVGTGRGAGAEYEEIDEHQTETQLFEN